MAADGYDGFSSGPPRLNNIAATVRQSVYLGVSLRVFAELKKTEMLFKFRYRTSIREIWWHD